MHGLGVFLLLVGLVVAGPALAQRSSAGTAGKDACETEANRLYAGMRDFEERMRVKREFTRKCRADARGGRR